VKSLRSLKSSRKGVLAFLMAACLMVGTVTGAAAFEPPRDPANKFSCPGGDPVVGHPGSAGLAGRISEDHLGPWNAVFAPNPHGSPIALCE
jgi:hypothetical protein